MEAKEERRSVWLPAPYTVKPDQERWISMKVSERDVDQEGKNKAKCSDQRNWTLNYVTTVTIGVCEENQELSLISLTSQLQSNTVTAASYCGDVFLWKKNTESIQLTKQTKKPQTRSDADKIRRNFHRNLVPSLQDYSKELLGLSLIPKTLLSSHPYFHKQFCCVIVYKMWQTLAKNWPSALHIKV